MTQEHATCCTFVGVLFREWVVERYTERLGGVSEAYAQLEIRAELIVCCEDFLVCLIDYGRKSVCRGAHAPRPTCRPLS
jgi:hypothetical protein